MSNLPTEILDVYSIDEETDDETLIGKVEYGPLGRLTLLEANADQEEFLNNVLSTVNAKEQIVQKVPPSAGSPPASATGAYESDDDDAPEADGAPAPRVVEGTRSKVVGRSDEAFFAALQAYLTSYYGISLS